MKIYKNNSFKKSLFLIFAFFLIFSPIKLGAKIDLIDRVIAVVDSGVIMETELNQRLKQVIGKIRESGTELPPKKILEEQVLERLIVEEIQLQIGEKAGIKISDAELNSTLSVMASENALTLEEFKKSLESEEISYRELRDNLRKEMIMQRVQRGKVGPRIDVSEQEIKNFLNSEEGKSRLAEEYNVQQILIPIKSGSSKEKIKEAQNKAELIIEKFNQGEAFPKLATTYSAGQNALEGGSLGWKKASELPSLFIEEIKKLKVGEISNVIMSGAGCHILLLAEKRGSTVRFEDQTNARHILVQSTEIRTESQTEALIKDLHQRLLEGESFRELARQYSEDPGSKMQGGELGWSDPSTYDPAFKGVMNETEVNELSLPFKSSYGWHILEVLGRRNEDVSEEVRKNRAYQIIFTRKFEQELQRTLVEMRAEAYVDIKLDS